MATGIPRPRTANPRNAPTHSEQGISLAYEGKKPEAEILSTEPDTTRLLWSTDPDPCAGDWINRLYYGDNRLVLPALLRDASILGKVRLVYIDPPFATRSLFQSRTQEHAYGDLLSGAHYVEFMRESLLFLRELLAEDGSIYVHLDENMAFHIKIVMDEIFGRANFLNWITRKKCNPKNYTRNTYGNISDFVLFYTKTESYVWNRAYEEWTEQRITKEYQYVEPETGRRYKKVPLHAPGIRHGQTGQPWVGKNPPPGKHWQYPPRVLDEMNGRGEIYWSPNGNPRRRVYWDDSQGVPVQDIWLDFRDAHNQNIKITGYPTEKNPDLLARIVAASSNEGDLVLDAFSGSGTSLGVSSQLGRRWIGIDSSPQAIIATINRLERGPQPMGDFVRSNGRANGALSGEQMRLPLGQRSTQYAVYASEPYDGSLDAVLSVRGGAAFGVTINPIPRGVLA